MKIFGIKLYQLLTVVAVVAILLMPLIVLAGQVYDREVVTIPASGAVRWTNDIAYSALDLERIWVEGNLYATNVVTVKRVTSDGAYTQTVGAVTCASGSGSQATFTAGFMKYGDMLDFSSFVGTNAAAILEYIVQQH